jgi:hypothetical protein
MQLKKRCGRKEIIVPAGFEHAGEPKANAQEPLVTALARAFHWQGLIDSGRYKSIAALASALGADRSYVRRILGLACLAPDIVTAIVAGTEPSGLSLDRLVKTLPMGWEEQRKVLGFRQKQGAVA